VDQAGNWAPVTSLPFTLVVCPHDKVEVKILQQATTITTGVMNNGLSKSKIGDPNQYLKNNPPPIILGVDSLPYPLFKK
jgi:hypothetical protein